MAKGPDALFKGSCPRNCLNTSKLAFRQILVDAGMSRLPGGSERPLFRNLREPGGSE